MKQEEKCCRCGLSMEESDSFFNVTSRSKGVFQRKGYCGDCYQKMLGRKYTDKYLKKTKCHLCGSREITYPYKRLYSICVLCYDTETVYDRMLF